jgi:hypothetical protein
MLKPLWSREFPRNAQTPRIAFARTTNVILVLTDHLYGIDPHSGATRWTRPNLGEPVAAAGRYIVATRGNQTVLFDERGTEQWANDLCGSTPIAFGTILYGFALSGSTASI